MKRLFIILAGPAYLLILAGFTCTRFSAGDEDRHAYFWKKSDPAISYYLYLDDKEMGVLPFLPDSLTRSAGGLAPIQGLSLMLKPGSYELSARDVEGNVLCQGTLFLRRTGEIRTRWSNETCRVGIEYVN